MDAKRYTGPNPRILALPRTFRTAGVHLAVRAWGARTREYPSRYRKGQGLWLFPNPVNPANPVKIARRILCYR